MKSAPALLALLVAVGCHDDVPVKPPDSQLLRVVSVEILQLESFPVQVTAQVKGTVPDPCTVVEDVRQSRTGNTIDVTITVTRRGESCPQVVTDVTHDVRLTGSFPPGDYIVRVNGFERRFTVA